MACAYITYEYLGKKGIHKEKKEKIDSTILPPSTQVVNLEKTPAKVPGKYGLSWEMQSGWRVLSLERMKH